MEKYIVSCSGGVDSVVLAHWLHSKNQLHTIYHFVYNEPKEFSENALNVVKQMSLEWNVHLKISTEKSDNINNKEYSWRKQRFESVYQYSKETGLKLALGHHLDDQMTSYVLSLIKESSRCFIPLENNLFGVDIIRPFLYDNSWDKDKIINYAVEHNLEYVEDPMNLIGDRSIIDLILPDLKQIQQFKPVFLKKYCKFLKKVLE